MLPESPSSAPFGTAGMTYLTRGWGPIPLPARAKHPPPTSWTGYAAPYPSGADVTEWASNGAARGNVGLRLPTIVLGIDVDAYGDKRGATTLLEAEHQLGALPDTWISTSRDDSVSGIRFYLVPADRCWADVVGPDVEVIHHGHRYAVVAPSVHPTGAVYRWLGPDGAVCSGPRVDDLPELPAAWVAQLDRGSVADRAVKADVAPVEAVQFLMALVGGEPCRYLSGLLDDAAAELALAGSRHDVGRAYVARMVRGGEQGHHGAVRGLERLQGLWVAALGSGERRAPDPGEWDRMVTGAVGIVTADPTPAVDVGCCGEELTPGFSFDPGVSVTDFWTARPELARIHAFARARAAAPWPVLGVVLARVVTQVTARVVLPPLVGSHASLNLFVALVGSSGGGKGAAETCAIDAVRFSGEVEVATVGSGEGIGHLYAHREKGAVVRDRESVLFTVPEVDNLTALGNRQGATLMPQLRQAWSGEQLGFSYADKNKALPIHRHTYRMGLVLGVQPGRAGPLLDDSVGGTPQRFVWLPTIDPDAPREPPPEPPAWHWAGTGGPWLFEPSSGLAVMGIPAVAREAVIEANWARLHGDVEALDGHALLCRLKVAAALALLAQRHDVDDSDWELAGMVMTVSDATRATVVSQLAATSSARNLARAEAEGDRAVVVADRLVGAQAKRVAGVIVRAMRRRDGVMTHRDIVHSVASTDRSLVEQALDALGAEGHLEIVPGPGSPTYRLKA